MSNTFSSNEHAVFTSQVRLSRLVIGMRLNSWHSFLVMTEPGLEPTVACFIPEFLHSEVLALGVTSQPACWLTRISRPHSRCCPCSHLSKFVTPVLYSAILHTCEVKPKLLPQEALRNLHALPSLLAFPGPAATKQGPVYFPQCLLLPPALVHVTLSVWMFSACFLFSCLSRYIPGQPPSCSPSSRTPSSALMLFHTYPVHSWGVHHMAVQIFIYTSARSIGLWSPWGQQLCPPAVSPPHTHTYTLTYYEYLLCIPHCGEIGARALEMSRK